MDTLEIEIMLMSYFNIRRNVIVPNVSWGLSLHECDLLVLTPANNLIEIEIKTSLADLKADKKKGHKHSNNKISKLYFAIPDYLEPNIDLIPEHAGILIARSEYKEGIAKGLKNREYFSGITKKREAKLNGSKIELDDTIRQELCRLGTMRIFNLKKQIKNLKKNPIIKTYE